VVSSSLRSPGAGTCVSEAEAHTCSHGSLNPEDNIDVTVSGTCVSSARLALGIRCTHTSKNSFICRYDADVIDQFSAGDLRAIGGNFSHVEFATHYGRTLQLFDNPHTGRSLYRMGLRPDTAFGCAFNYLFEPHPEALKPYAEELRVLQDPGVLKIGIHIRIGDAVFSESKPGAELLESVRQYFDCAKQIEESRLLPGQTAAWFLVSDAVPLREAARAAYGGKLLTPAASAVHHVLASHGGGGAQTVQSAVAENWLLGLADNFVLTPISGFGRLAVFRSLLTSAAYLVPKDGPRSCGVREYDSWRGMAEAFGAGI